MAVLTTILVWAGIVAGSLVALVVLSFVAYLVWSALTGGLSPKGVELEASWPPLLGVDQAFSLSINVRNLVEKERVLYSIDFDNSLLKGFVVRQVEPKSSNDSSGLGTTAYYFNSVRIPPRGNAHITFLCHTVVAGDFSGNVQAYVDYRHSKSVDKALRLVIR